MMKGRIMRRENIKVLTCLTLDMKSVLFNKAHVKNIYSCHAFDGLHASVNSNDSIL